MKKSRSVFSRLVSMVLLGALVCTMTGCSGKEKISLSIWSTDTKVDLVDKVMKRFQEIHEDEVEIEWTISKEEEVSCKETVLSNPEGAADIYSFADDQLDELKDAGALLSIPGNPDETLAPFGGKGSTAYESVVRDGGMYAYPESANGYFLYYNKRYFDPKEIESLERIIQIAGNENKKVVMDFSSGWYLYSFFRAAGLKLHPDKSGTKNICDWNKKKGKITGKDVARKMLSIATSRGFKSMGDDAFVEGVKNGTVIAGVNGAWNSDKISEAWGEDYGAAKLPTFRIGKEDLQMASFTGYKVIGINAHTQYPEWCKKFLDYFTSEENQIMEFEETGEVPANLDVVGSDEVKQAPAVRALADQAPYASLQRVAAPYWDASSKFGVTIASGNPDKQSLQELLDKMVEGITG